MAAPYAKLPGWVDYGLIPLINLTVAFIAVGVIFYAAGENPLLAARHILVGAFGSGDGIGYTLFYTTSFIFTGLCVAVAFHAGLFNIGGEGQAYVGGFGVALICLTFDNTFPWWINLPLATIAAAFVGALWALIPAWLQAKRGSHIVITTIMFNFIAAGMMVAIITGPLRPENFTGAVATRNFAEGAQLPRLDWMLEMFGLTIRSAPLNITFLLALLAAFLVWVLIWRTKLGYEIRTFGFSPKAAEYAGISQTKIIITAMMISGALAGMMALNPVMGSVERLQESFALNFGFGGIAVALMGRSHPIGVVLAALLFGVLYQGGAEIAFQMPNISAQMIVTIQGLVILFAGALEHMFRPSLSAIFGTLAAARAENRMESEAQ